MVSKQFPRVRYNDLRVGLRVPVMHKRGTDEEGLQAFQKAYPTYWWTKVCMTSWCLETMCDIEYLILDFGYGYLILDMDIGYLILDLDIGYLILGMDIGYWIWIWTLGI